jgi:hypothetical protein
MTLTKVYEAMQPGCWADFIYLGKPGYGVIVGPSRYEDGTLYALKRKDALTFLESLGKSDADGFLAHARWCRQNIEPAFMAQLPLYLGDYDFATGRHAA